MQSLSQGAADTEVTDGRYTATLPLARTLRPPPTAGLSERPAYDPSKVNFCCFYRIWELSAVVVSIGDMFRITG